MKQESKKFYLYTNKKPMLHLTVCIWHSTSQIISLKLAPFTLTDISQCKLNYFMYQVDFFLPEASCSPAVLMAHVIHECSCMPHFLLAWSRVRCFTCRVLLFKLHQILYFLILQISSQVWLPHRSHFLISLFWSNPTIIRFYSTVGHIPHITYHRCNLTFIGIGVGSVTVVPNRLLAP